MIRLDFKKNLSERVKGDILVYLEKRPLGEVYALFQSIVAELTAEESNGSVSERVNPAPPGSGDACISGDCLHVVEDE